ncbi:PilN domain-containing protein [Loktanella sp. IMCC34160]|uniref:PilN domain-containing protein n=1 Tax=Loktanella sp. IMCC34160 TaxID=2510646 RepID=UPI001A924407|nr:PilN domain-containing protein [Loktanella sp. IMCC34160]
MPGLRAASARVVEITEIDLEDLTGLRQRLSGSRSGPVTLRLAGALVLFKSQSIPRKAGRKARKVLDLRASAIEEGLGEPIAVATRAMRRTGQERTYSQAILRRSDLDQILTAVTTSGAMVRQVVAVDPEGAELVFVDGRARADRGAWLWWSLGALCLLAVLLWKLWTLEAREGWYLAALQAAERNATSAQAALETAMAASETTEEAQAEVDALLAALDGDRGAVRTLARLTEALPRQAWLQSIDLRSSQLTISGSTSGPVQEVIDALDRVDWTASVGLDRPVVLDRVRQQSNFDLTLDLARKSLP